jgi:hypothetical protein
MTALGPEANGLLDAARYGDEPTHADRDRVRAAIAARLAAGAAAAIGVGMAAKAPASALGTAGGASAAAAPVGVATKVLIAAALVGAIGVGAATVGVALRSPKPPAQMPAQPVPVAVDVPASAGGPTQDTASRPGEAVALSEARAAGSRPTLRTGPVTAGAALSAHAAAATGDVAAEVRLLSEAHAAMRGGDAERALVLLEEHARRYPKGALGEERDAAKIAALCALGRVAEARQAADRFLRAAPLSPHAGPIRASCGGPLAMPAPRF